MTWAVLASGSSMSQEVADSVRHLPTVAVSDTFRLAPWARAMYANDAAWWQANQDAAQFAGEKFSARARGDGIAEVRPGHGLGTGTNSGLCGLHLAITLGGRRERYLLCGFDLRGNHFFGAHQAPLKNPDAARFAMFLDQFRRYAKTVRDVDIVNCTAGSALEVFPQMSIAQALEREAA
jgi:hypothetical protein